MLNSLPMRRYFSWESTGLISNNEGEVMPIEIARIGGVRLAYNQYVGSVKLFLKHYGE